MTTTVILVVIYIISAAITIFIISHNTKRANLNTRNVYDALLSPEGLEKHAVEIARNHIVKRNKQSVNWLLARMNENYRFITEVYKKMNDDVNSKKMTVPAAEWLLDNFYIIEQEVKQVRQSMIGKFYSQLPTLEEGALKGYPRVYAIALELIAHTDGSFDDKILISFIKAYQSHSLLTTGELWAISMMIRIALVENIRRICEKLDASQQQLLKADEFIKRLLTKLDDQSDVLLQFMRENIKETEKINSSFAEHVLQSLKKEGRKAVPVLQYLDEALAAQDATAENIIQTEHQDQAVIQVSIGNSITSFRLISALDWTEIFEILSPIEKILLQDPANVYAQMDFDSRDYYRSRVVEFAKRLRVSETQIARKTVECALEHKGNKERLGHVGYYLVGNGKETLKKRLGYRTKGIARITKKYPAQLYISLIALGMVIAIVFFVNYVENTVGRMSVGIGIFIVLTVLIPAADIVVSIVNWLITHMCRASILPKLELRDGIPDSHATMVVIPTLLPSVQRVEELLLQIEVHYLANKEKNLYFGLIGDFKDANQKEMAHDKEIVNTAISGIDLLNQRYGSEIFYFFHRHRQYNDVQKKWMGWERKRGALMEFNRLLRGATDTSFSIITGNIAEIPNIKYVITLDADTRIGIGTAKKLVGTMMHPLNHPIIDPVINRVIDGYGLLQPRINVDIESANKTLFSKVFAGQGGLDPYTTAVSDVYQDLLNEGIFTGKGIYDIEIFQKTLEDAIPDNAVLSHDLLEGSYVRVGLATDIELIDGYPARYNAYMARLHRWVRGDWQLIPWLFPKVRNRKGHIVRNPLSSASKWKIVDNLRRSLSAPALLFLIICAFSILPGSKVVWLLFVLLTILFPLLIASVDAVLYKNYRFYKERCHATIICGLKAIIYQIGLLFVFLPYQAYIMGDAIVRTLVRVFFTRRNMLEWVTAADMERSLKNDLKSFWRKMRICIPVAVAILVLSIVYTPNVWPIAFIFFIAWSAAPYIAYRISVVEDDTKPLASAEDIEELRKLARKTWRYFEDFVTERDHYLPPDNYQEDPPNGVAHRTSPTNIGLLLVSILAAKDMGYIGTLETTKRLKNTLLTVQKMKKWNGHLYNWYDTRTLKGLRPLYVSTVDSGNFLGYLITLKQGLKEYMERPLLDTNLALGLLDTIKVAMKEDDSNYFDTQMLENLIAMGDALLPEWKNLLDKLSQKISNMTNKKDSYWNRRLSGMIASFQDDIRLLASWVKQLELLHTLLQDTECFNNKYIEKVKNIQKDIQNRASLNTLVYAYPKAIENIEEIIMDIETTKKDNTERSSCRQHDDILMQIKEFKKSLEESNKNINNLLKEQNDLIDMIQVLIDEMQFAPLFDEKRQLFSIGYNLEAEKLTKSYYDILASEARQTSFIAIIRGEVNVKHWFRLGRNLTAEDGYKGLVSWTGTMFEYLMPLLIMRNYKNTLWDETYWFVLRSQKKYGKKRQVPWGTSESGYYAFDINLNYQYRAFGVPGLGLKRGLVNDTVVTPYATVMALMVDPIGAIRNLRRLQNEGLDGSYGFYEAIDYTPQRLSKGQKSGIVKSFMVHHQGMSLMALVNYLNGNIMQKRFHAEPVVKSGELLLQERVPIRVIMTKENKEKIKPLKPIERKYESLVKVLGLPNALFPYAHILSNGRYSVALTDSGAGYSKKNGMLITRWREHLLPRNDGLFLLIKNINTNQTWSTAFAPYYTKPDRYQVIFSADKVEFLRKDDCIDTHTEVVVSPEDDVEIRRITLTNHSQQAQVLEVTSYLEVVLTTHAADIAHPTFSNLFVRTEYIEEHGSLLANRRPREQGSEEDWLAHALIVEGEVIGDKQFETDRAKFIGRGQTISTAIAMRADQPLSNTAGAVLDPIMSLRQRIRIAPEHTVHVTYITGISNNRVNALKLAQKYQDITKVLRAFELAWTRSQVESRYLGLSAGEKEKFEQMIPHILFLSPLRRKWEDFIYENRKGQQSLWTYGISGDIPIVTVSITNAEEIESVQQLLKAHEYWRMRGLIVDLIILYEDEGSYTQPLYQLLTETVSASHAREIQDKPGGVFIRSGKKMPDEDKTLLFTAARVVIWGDKGSLASQLKLELEQSMLPEVKVWKKKPREYKYQRVELEQLLYNNGLGGFNKDRKEYVICLRESQYTPAPWINVISNHRFGFIVTELGGGYTWAKNSRENKLTPWSNDPVSDAHGEIFYLRDEETGEVWTATPSPIREKEPYIIRHGRGYSVFEHTSHDIEQKLTMFVPKHEPVKLGFLKLRNITNESRVLSATYYIRPVLGVNEHFTAQYIATHIHPEKDILLIENPYNDAFPGRIAYVDVSEMQRTYSGNRKEFFIENRVDDIPAALRRESLSNDVGAGYDPCAAMQIKISLQAGEEKEIVFQLGQSKDLREVEYLSTKYRKIDEAKRALSEVENFWEDVLSVIQVQTPDESMNLMLNSWLLYQTLACRIQARSAFYQSGGAYGFRDQLQDVMAMVYAIPEITYSQILRHASHQFVEGDVQHWWHVVEDVGAQADRGIRTMFSDDLLWLPFVVADFIGTTEDFRLLDEEIPFIEDLPLKEGEYERYNIPRKSDEKGSIYQHCIRAIEHALKFGEHGIPLMGSGDWNDGMNTVGNKGRGESVWLGWFLFVTLQRFIPICKAKKDIERAQRYERISREIIEAIEKNAWDGAWYRRAYFDDATPLGSAQNSECKIDSLSQSWAVISNAADPERVKIAMEALEHYLIRKDEGVILLLTPPFDKGELSPGYIKGYVPGVRENGGQYTHAAIWVILAFAKMGRGDKAWELFNLINPINHSRTPIEAARYKVEPYVMAADVYAVVPNIGRGGWTWYTGAAGWMYRVGIEHLLGFKKKGDKLHINPCIPKNWSEYKMRYRYLSTVYNINIINPEGVNNGVKEVYIDGVSVKDKIILLKDDGKEYQVEVVLGEDR